MSTLTVVEEILRETAMPMSVREIVDRAGPRLPSKSKTPDTVVARDLSMDIKKKGEESLFVRTSPGRYTLRTLAALTPRREVDVVEAVPSLGALPAPQLAPAAMARPGPPMSALPARKPPVAAATAPPARSRADTDVGNGFVG